MSRKSIKLYGWDRSIEIDSQMIVIFVYKDKHTTLYIPFPFYHKNAFQLFILEVKKFKQDQCFYKYNTDVKIDDFNKRNTTATISQLNCASVEFNSAFLAMNCACTVDAFSIRYMWNYIRWQHCLGSRSSCTEACWSLDIIWTTVFL